MNIKSGTILSIKKKLKTLLISFLNSASTTVLGRLFSFIPRDQRAKNMKQLSLTPLHCNTSSLNEHLLFPKNRVNLFMNFCFEVMYMYMWDPLKFCGKTS